jgi:hypothetical protein
MTKEMTAEQLELFRLAILKIADANRTRFGLTKTAFIHVLPMYGFQVTDAEQLEEAIDYLVRKGLFVEVLKSVSRENRAWRITEGGIAFLDNHG